MSNPKSMQELLEGRHFDGEVIILCVRWYLRFWGFKAAPAVWIAVLGA